MLAAAGLVLAGIAGVVALRPSRTPPADDGLAGLGEGIDDVTLLNQDGQAVRWGDLRGGPRALFFGFTHCPVICPVTVWELNHAMDKIGAPAASLAIEFVTIDPERDTPARLRDYFSGFAGRVHGYSGTPEAIAQIAGGFEIIYNRTAPEGEAGDYSMDHTTTVFLIDGAGKVADVIGYGSPPELIEARLRALVGA